MIVAAEYAPIKKSRTFFVGPPNIPVQCPSHKKKKKASVRISLLAGKYDPMNIIQNAVGIFYQNISISSRTSLINKSHIMVQKKAGRNTI
jgi:hypothetical protein